ncbi:amino acid ABC transporter [Paramagnetospirillum marisnigri]|uniref:Amino acid ABC transporter n=1 Tax=Paramagnetospirillum marisnigri TaxID=1285242 RepID=A0A178M792_9PROT|nr:amino acid ABC transporter [Paramagnetospirillum marisnigri]
MVALVVTLISCGPAWAQSSPKHSGVRELEYAFPDQSVWTTRTDENGDPENPLLRLAAAMFDKAGIPWHAKRYPAARMFNYLNDGTAEFSMLVNAPSLKECCLLSRSPVASTDLRVYHLPGKPPVKTKEDLIGKRIITIRGYSYGGLLSFISDPANNISNNTAIKHETAFSMLEAGRGDYLLDYTGPALEVLSARPIPGVQYETLSRLDVFLVLAKSYPDAQAVMNRLEAIVESLNKDEIIRGQSR